MLFIILNNFIYLVAHELIKYFMKINLQVNHWNFLICKALRLFIVLQDLFIVVVRRELQNNDIDHYFVLPA